MSLKLSKNNLKLFIKGFAMGTADVVPGVSGGTVALITGVYDELVKTIGLFDHRFVKTLLSFDLKKILEESNARFLIPLGIGIVGSILIMARVMHYMLDNFAVQTWSMFFGLIVASILFLLKSIENLKTLPNLVSVIIGTGLGYAVVSLIPVSTPETFIAVFLSGFVGICAMILPGISGSFILLILGKYYFITSMLKNPFAGDHLIYIMTFSFGCLCGLLSFSKLINFLLNRFHGITMCVLVGFMIGSLKKIWPWKTIDQAKMINGKLKVLTENIYFPSQIDSSVMIAFLIMALGFSLVYIIEKSTSK